MVRINIEIDDEIHKKAKINSITKGITLIDYVTLSIEEKLKRDKTKWQE
jgi:hypothetical protein